MNIIVYLARRFSERARDRRAKVFQQSFHLNESTRLLDLGRVFGENIHRDLCDTNIRPEKYLYR